MSNSDTFHAPGRISAGAALFLALPSRSWTASRKPFRKPSRSFAAPYSAASSRARRPLQRRSGKTGAGSGDLGKVRAHKHTLHHGRKKRLRLLRDLGKRRKSPSAPCIRASPVSAVIVFCLLPRVYESIIALINTVVNMVFLLMRNFLFL